MSFEQSLTKLGEVIDKASEAFREFLEKYGK